MKINNCPQLINEFGYEAVSRDNICKTQCSFVLNALNPEGTATGQARPHQNFFIESDTLQAPGFFGNIGHSFDQDQASQTSGSSKEQVTPESNLQNGNGGPPASLLTSTVIPQPQNNNGRPFRGPTSVLGTLGRPGGPPVPPPAPLPPGITVNYVKTDVTKGA